MTTTESIYRVFRSTWGIHIGIVASYTALSDDAYSREAVKLGEGIHINDRQVQADPQSALLPDEQAFLQAGLRRVSSLILRHSEYGNRTLIVVSSVTIAPCDFQAEGLEAAMMHWASEAFGFELPQFEVEFDEAKNRYEFRM
ncbi:hypothetical protein [Saccharibacillus sacchari]|uniref:Uncharacterized protein n=1 Tax=Saccharibacillus sacchari TaxID=456493 RepID=A0ACC6PEW6_9BACL